MRAVTETSSVRAPVTFEDAEKTPMIFRFFKLRLEASFLSTRSRKWMSSRPNESSGMLIIFVVNSLQGRMFEWCSKGPMRIVGGCSPGFWIEWTNLFTAAVAPEPQKIISSSQFAPHEFRIIVRASSLH